MSGEHPIAVGRVREAAALRTLLEPFEPGGGPFIIVPNWHTDLRGYGTDAATLECVLEALPGEKILVEAYDGPRTRDPARFHDGDLDSARAHREYLREEDRRFFERTGIGQVLQAHGARYLNVTEEIWAGRAAPADAVRQAVERRFGPVAREELYGMVPQALWALRGATLIDLAKIKAWAPAPGQVFFSLSLKNLFGLIPVPDRGRYHGADNRGLSRNIVDMNRIYGALFRVLPVAEAMHATLLNGTVDLLDEAALVEGMGLVAVADRAVDLDAYLVRAMGQRPEERHFLRLAAEAFGPWDEAAFPPMPAELEQALAAAMAGRRPG